MPARIKAIWGASVALLTVVAALGFMASTAAAAPPGMPELHPNDPGYLNLRVPYDRIDAPAYWQAITQRSCSVGILDVDDVDGTVGVADVAPSIKAVQSFSSVSSTGDGSFHATRVASVLSASINNGQGTAGLSNCPVYMANVYDPPPTYWLDSYVANGLNWRSSLPNVRVCLVEVQAKPGDDFSQALANIRSAAANGCLVVVPAGNLLYGQPYSALAAATAGIPGVIRVTGVQWDSGLGTTIDANSIAHGAAAADITAPVALQVVNPDGSVTGQGGTSIAAPVVAAIAAEMFSFNPGLTNADVVRLLQSSGTQSNDWRTGAPLDVGCHCIVNALTALEATGYSPPAVKLSLTITKGGTVDANYDNGDLGICNKSCVLKPYVGAAFELNAVPADGYTFAGWAGACKGKSFSCDLSLNADAAVSAVFKALKISVTIKKTGKGTVSFAGMTCGPGKARCPASVESGKLTKLTAKPAAGWKFVRWEGACKGTKPVCALKLTKAAAVVAVFSMK